MPFVSDVLDPTGGTIDMLAMQAEHWDGNERLPGRPSVAAKDNIHVHLFILSNILYIVACAFHVIHFIFAP